MVRVSLGYLCLWGAVVGWPVQADEARRPALVGDRSAHPFGRGFDLDLGLDFAQDVDGIPLNTPGHVLGAGHLDAGLLIPELVEGQVATRGSYLGGQGPFAVAGSASVSLVRRLETPRFACAYGGDLADRHARLVWAQTLARPEITYALEFTRGERPWSDFLGASRINAALLRRGGGALDGWSFTALGSEEKTDGGSATPSRACDDAACRQVEAARVGDGSRYQRLLLGWNRHEAMGSDGARRVQVYGGAHLHRLWRNWTFFREDPVWGDQRHHLDRRAFLGMEASRTWHGSREPRAWTRVLGGQARVDRMEGALEATQERKPVEGSCFRPSAAQAHLLHASVYGQSDHAWPGGWHAWIALRLDGAAAQVGDLQGGWRPGEGGLVLGSPRAGLFWSPTRALLLGIQAGGGTRRGDALRGERPLLRSRSAEAFVQVTPRPDWTSGVTLWSLRVEGESLFDPGSGAFASWGPARHEGVETRHEIQRGPWRWELAWAWGTARLKEGGRVPGAMNHTGYVGIAWKDPDRCVDLRLRRTGARSLLPAGGLEVPRQDSVELRVEQALGGWALGLEIQNAFSRRTVNRAYYFPSRLPSEDRPVWDLHPKSADPQSIRIDLRNRF